MRGGIAIFDYPVADDLNAQIISLHAENPSRTYGQLFGSSQPYLRRGLRAVVPSPISLASALRCLA